MWAIVIPPGALDLLEFTAMNGFFSYASETHLQLAIGGCPYAPILAGTWLGLAKTAEWELCLGGDENVSVDCDLGSAPVPNETRGFGNNVPLTCSSSVIEAERCPPPVSLESGSWGSIKTLHQ
jgi:hypothetical protein